MLTIDELFELAKNARELAYVPYSHFKVGAVIECKDGTIITGANIENAVLGLTVCAERNAIFQAYLKGYRNTDFVQMAICASSNSDITTPCGSCRQVLSELFDIDAPLYCFNLQKEYLKTSVRELLPYSFGKENL